MGPFLSIAANWRVRAVLCGAALAFAVTAARANQPYVTDDADVLERGAGEVYLFSDGDLARGDVSQGLAGLDLAYGISDRLEFDATLRFDREAHGHAARYGMDAAELGFEYRLFEQKGWRPALAVAPSLALPFGHRALAAQCPCATLPLWVQWEFGAWTASGGGGYRAGYGTNGRLGWFAGAALTRALSRRLSLGVEAFHLAPQAADEGAYEGVDAVLILAAGRRLEIGFSAGLGAENARMNRLTYRFAMGWKT